MQSPPFPRYLVPPRSSTPTDTNVNRIQRSSTEPLVQLSYCLRHVSTVNRLQTNRLTICKLYKDTAWRVEVCSADRIRLIRTTNFTANSCNGFVCVITRMCFSNSCCLKRLYFNSLKTKRRPLYLKPQSVPRCKHFSSGL